MLLIVMFQPVQTHVFTRYEQVDSHAVDTWI